MRPVYLTLAAIARSPWVPLNRNQSTFQVGLSVSLTTGAVLTYSVQHTFDELGQDFRQVAIARAATVATVTDTDHRLKVGDSLIVAATGDANFEGEQIVASIVDANTYTYTVANSGAAAGAQTSKLKSFRVYNHAALVGLSADADGNYDFPCMASRLILTAYTSGKATLSILQGMARE